MDQLRKKSAVVCVSMLAACAIAAEVGRIEYTAADLAKRTATVSWTWTELADTAVRLRLTRNGEDFETAGWGGTLFLGDGALGCAVAGTPKGYNELFFDVDRGNVPTNGKYAVQIIATNTAGRVEEWARGTLTVRANPSAEGMSTNWSAYAELARKVAPYIDARGILSTPANADALWNAVSNRTDALTSEYVGKAVADAVPSRVEDGMGRVLADGRTARPAGFGDWSVVSCDPPYRKGEAGIGLKGQPEYHSANGRWTAKFVNLSDPSGLAIGTAGWTPPLAEGMFALRGRVTNIVFTVRDASDNNRTYSVEVARPVTSWAWDEIALSSQIPHVPEPDGTTVVEDDYGRLGVADGVFASESDLDEHAARNDNPHNVTAEQAGAATTQRVAQVEANVASMWYTLYGESCWLAITNYMRTIPGVMPSFSLWEIRDGATNEVYSSRDEITNRVEAAVGPLRESVADALEEAESAKAWGRHQSADGSAAPPGYTVVSSTNLVLTGGGRWEGIVLETLGQTFWVFSGAGGLASTSEGKLRCIDANGDTAFEVTTGTMQTLPAIPASFQVESTADGKDLTFSVYATDAPTLWSATDLLGPWFAHSNATWTAGLSNTYTVAMTVDSTSPAMFFRATYELGQQPCVKFAKPLELTRVKIGGTIYNVSVSDGKLALTEAN